ncbi:hypothetical protein M5K25_003926 [Dendrobium thyrsiflorum]|uniref:Uncharacterized protein n=1 Tax=Dendrobium thyrsiflorum TaxID=117978 RepID=A0ABD0VT13_DENTH
MSAHKCCGPGSLPLFCPPGCSCSLWLAVPVSRVAVWGLFCHGFWPSASLVLDGLAEGDRGYLNSFLL